jgi:hypothetical protein
MADEFLTINLTAVEQQLNIEVGDAGNNVDAQPETYVIVEPPITNEEYMELIEQVDPRSKIGYLLTGSLEKDGEGSRFTAEGAPSEENVNLGLELAKRIIGVRGIRSGKVVAAIGENVTSYLVWVK